MLLCSCVIVFLCYSVYRLDQLGIIKWMIVLQLCINISKITPTSSMLPDVLDTQFRCEKYQYVCIIRVYLQMRMI